MKLPVRLLLAIICFLSATALHAEVPEPVPHGGYAVAPAGSFDIARAPAPLYRCPITDGAADPSLVWVQEDGSWLIYYTARRANVAVQGVGWVYGTQIGIARSRRPGADHWEFVGFCQNLGRGRQAETFWAPHVFIENGVFHMFVTYIPRIGGNGNWAGKGQIAHYTSDDGEHWQDRGIV